MISLTNHDSSEGEQWGRYNLSRSMENCDEIHDNNWELIDMDQFTKHWCFYSFDRYDGFV